MRIGQDGKPQLCVGMLPGRARPSLYLWTALDIRPLATFRSLGAAEECADFLLGMVGARVVDGDVHCEPTESEAP